MKFLTVYQIYFNPEQEKLIEPEYIGVYNKDCTVYFENEVIKNFILKSLHANTEYFGVISHKLREKIGAVMKERWSLQSNIANHSTQEFTPVLFESELRKGMPDAMSFQRHIGHDPITVADRFHPGFKKHFEFIMKEIGYTWTPTHITDPFYCNFFVAKSEVYHKYVNEMLMPAMRVMDKIPELMHDSRYPNKLPQHLAVKWDINHYPFHSFLCERMFSWFAHVHKLKCRHY